MEKKKYLARVDQGGWNSAAATNCVNGYYDGIKCVCTDEMYYGVFCENIIDRIPPVTTVETAVAVVMTVTSEVFTEDLNNFESETFKAFEEKFTQQIEEAYAVIPGYKGIKIIGFRNGSIIVDYEVIVELEYKEDVNITQQYEEIFKQVEEKVTELVTTLSNCSDNTTLCFDEKVSTGRVDIPSPCSKIATEFKEYYMELLIPEGMTCVSQCDPINPKSQNCNEGRCVIQKSVGPQCLCPRTDLYLYTSAQCTGKILKSGIYGGVGAAIGILFIIIIAVSIFLVREKQKPATETFQKYDEDPWSNESEDQWNNQTGITNVQFEALEEEDAGSESSKEKFRPRLETVDTNVEVKIQRPQVSFA
ncbi:mucin-17-like [Hyperolius riggenbachi]|uniref:mucin-17-like n=1 Tax=Hyperolius riggenbachi TaxID=752182 RepID=UPI0035A35475